MSSSGNFDVWILASRMSQEDATFALARVFGVPREHAEQVVRRAPCRVKKRVDQSTAERFVAVLESAGFVAELRPDSPSSRPPPGRAASPQSLPPPSLRAPAALELAPVPRQVSERARALAASVSTAPPPMQPRERPSVAAPGQSLSRPPSVRPPRVVENAADDVGARRRAFAAGLGIAALGLGVFCAATVYGRSVLFGNLPWYWIFPEGFAAALVLVGLTRALRGAALVPLTLDVQPVPALALSVVLALVSNYFGPLSNLRPLHVRQAEIDVEASSLVGSTCTDGHTFVEDQRSSLGSLDAMRARTLLHALDSAGARRVCVVAGGDEDVRGIRRAERLVVVLGTRHPERVPAAAARVLGSVEGRLGVHNYILELP